MTTHQLVIPTRFDPSRSLLGRYLAKGSDRLRAEARYYFVAVLTLIGLVLVGFGTWAFLEQYIAESSGTGPTIFWSVQIAVAALFFAVCVVGFRPQISVTVDDARLTVDDGEVRLSLLKSDVTSVEVISPLVYHRHFRRYARVHGFIDRDPADVVLVRSGELIIAIGLAEQSADPLVEAVRSVGSSVTEAGVRMAL